MELRDNAGPSQDPAGRPQARRRKDSRRHMCLMARSPAHHLDRCGGVQHRHEQKKALKHSSRFKVQAFWLNTNEGKAEICNFPIQFLTKIKGRWNLKKSTIQTSC